MNWHFMHIYACALGSLMRLKMTAMGMDYNIWHNITLCGVFITYNNFLPNTQNRHPIACPGG